MIEIEKPSIDIVELSEDDIYGRFVVEPLERGYGNTLGEFPASGTAVLHTGCCGGLGEDSRYSA